MVTCIFCQVSKVLRIWERHNKIDTFVVLFQAAYQSGEDEVNLSTMGRTYTIDFNAMQQINEDTGTARPVQRKANPLATPGSAGAGLEGPLSRTSI